MGYILKIAFDHFTMANPVSPGARWDRETFKELLKEGTLFKKYDACENETQWLIDTKKALENGHELQVSDGTVWGLSKKHPGKVYIKKGKARGRVDTLGELEAFIASGGLKEDNEH